MRNVKIFVLRCAMGCTLSEMSGIAGILRRDGREVPPEWAQWLEGALALRTSTSIWRYEDSAETSNGLLQILLLSSSPRAVTDATLDESAGELWAILDGNMGKECAFAQWDVKRLQLNLTRTGTGRKPLYWLDLATGGDGLIFCSSPSPLLRIAHNLELPGKSLELGVKEYSKTGLVPEGGALLLPVCSIPLSQRQCAPSGSVSSVKCVIGKEPAEDLKLLVNLFGKPFADPSLLSSLWQYREAKVNGKTICEGLLKEPREKTALESIVVKFTGESRRRSGSIFELERSILLDAIASHVGIEVDFSSTSKQMKPIHYPLSSWFKTTQSSLGKLLDSTFRAPQSFSMLPIERKECLSLLQTHQHAKADYTQELFALLTLELWSQQVHG